MNLYKDTISKLCKTKYVLKKKKYICVRSQQQIQAIFLKK